jgi:hypothetical protein
MLSAATAAVVAPAEARKKKPRQPPFPVNATDTLLVQSGVFGTDLFVIGVLRCSDPAAVNKRIQQARQRSKYRCVLTHRSRNKYKVRYFKELLDDWQKHDDIRMQLRIVHPPKALAKPLAGAEWMRAYVDELSSALALAGVPAAEAGRLLTQPRFKGSRQAELEKMLRARHERITSVEKVRVGNCELMQLLTTVTGVVRASEDPSAYGSQVKSQTVKLLRQSLKTGDLKRVQNNKRFGLSLR